LPSIEDVAMNDTVSTGQQPLALARAEALARLRDQHAVDASAASAFALAKELWRNGRYGEALDLFTQARDLAPLAPDANVALVRAALTLGQRERAAAALAHALAAYPALPELAIQTARMQVATEPQAARAALAPHRHTDALAGLHHDAIDGVLAGREPGPRETGDQQSDAMWTGHRWLMARRPPPRVVGTAPELLALALDAAQVPGLVIECGVYFGRSLSQLAAGAGQRCHGFDSFQGAPPDGADAGSDSTGGVVPALGADVQLHPGWFQDTLPPFFAGHPGPIRLLHIDCGRQDAARTVLEQAGPRLVAGSVLAFGGLVGYPGSERQEFAAWHDHVRSTGIAWSVLAGTLLGREVAVRIDGTDA
jgi:hypothetical protein